MFSPSALTNRPPPLQDDDQSSSSALSSPELSPQNIDEIAVASAYRPVSQGVANPIPATAAQNVASHPVNTTTSDNAAAAPAKPKRQRKPKEPKPEGQDDKPKEKKPRKKPEPKEPKVKKEGDKAAAPRKRQKTEDKSTPGPADVLAGPRQSTITEMVNHFPPPNAPASAPPQQQSILLSQQQQYQPPSHSPYPRPQQPTSTDHIMRNSLPPHTSNPPTPRPYSSGQNYDPIRGATIDSAPSRPPPTTSAPHSAQPSPHLNRASASPSITSLIDPPPATKTSAPTMSHTQQTLSHQYQPPASFLPSQHHSPTPPKAAPAPPLAAPAPASPTPKFQTQNKSIPVGMDGAMDIDSPSCDQPAKPTQVETKTAKSSSSAPTPKAPAAKANSPPKATGSGLLSSSDLFGGPSSGQGTERKGTDIEIRITLNPSGGNTINMAQEIAKKYGRDAINPRAAAHRQRLLEVQAAANKLDGGSADDMSVDVLSEADGDSNVEMGVDGEKSATGADEKPVRKRRKKVEEYDKEDDFIDDTELAWQEQAAVAKDGFFVYSGPLVPEGQTAQVESTTTTRGRGGRGRGRGRAAAAAAAAGTTHASVAEKNKDPNAPTTGRGRGRGRGSGAPRKPRITKADRERMENEKAERERLASGGQPTSTSTTAFAPPSNAPANASLHAQSQPTSSYYPNVHQPATATTQSGPGVSV